MGGKEWLAIALLREAEALADGNADIVARVRQERLALDETMLHLWNVTVHRGTVPFAYSGENCLRRPVNGYSGTNWPRSSAC